MVQIKLSAELPDGTALAEDSVDVEYGEERTIELTVGLKQLSESASAEFSQD